MNRVLRAAVSWSTVYGEVEARLEKAGAVDALGHLHGMSQSELDLLIERELVYPVLEQGFAGGYNGRDTSGPGAALTAPDLAETCDGGSDVADTNPAHRWTATT